MTRSRGHTTSPSASPEIGRSRRRRAIGGVQADNEMVWSAELWLKSKFFANLTQFNSCSSMDRKRGNGGRGRSACTRGRANGYSFSRPEIVITSMVGQQNMLRMLSIQYLGDASAENEKKRRVEISTWNPCVASECRSDGSTTIPLRWRFE